MGVPDYILRMRKHVGNDLIWIPSVSAVVRNDAGELLLGQRTDDSRWSVVSGFVQPGEQPATAVVRKVLEETGLHVEPLRLSSAVAHPHRFPNGDRSQYLNLGFHCRLLGAEDDDESPDVRWFTPGQLPDVDEHSRMVIRHALGPESTAFFLPAGTRWGEPGELGDA